MTLLSVIIPVYNGGEYLAQALESIKLQGKVDDIECLVIDDGSTDDTLDIVKQFAAQVPLSIIPKHTERGWVSSSNLGLNKAKGTFSCFLHQDDIWLPGRLAALRSLLHKYPSIDCFMTAARFVDKEGLNLGAWAPTIDALPKVMSASRLKERLLIQNVLSIPAPIFRTNLAHNLGGLDDALWYTADWDFWLKLVSSGTVGYIPDETVGFRIHAASQTIVSSDNSKAFRAQMEQVLHRHTAQHDVHGTALRAAHFSIEVNVALAATIHGNLGGVLRLAKPFLLFDWRMLHAYFSYSCIASRTFSRLRAALRNLIKKP